LLKWKPPFIVQPKLDGVRCRAVPSPDIEYTLLSSEQNEIISVPHINAALKALGMWPTEFDGELYVHGLSFEDIYSITSRSVNLHHSTTDMQYHIFDLVNNKSQSERFLHLPLLEKHPLLSVEYYIADTLEDIMKAHDKILERGYEGIIVRNIFGRYERKRSTSIMKFKPKKDDYYKIINWKEEISIHGEPKGRMGALICTSDEGTIFSVGSGLTDGSREDLWNKRESIIGKLAHVKYQHITSGRRVPRFPVLIEVTEDEPAEIIIGDK
jgi:DNA ligase 1